MNAPIEVVVAGKRYPALVFADRLLAGDLAPIIIDNAHLARRTREGEEEVIYGTTQGEPLIIYATVAGVTLLERFLRPKPDGNTTENLATAEPHLPVQRITQSPSGIAYPCVPDDVEGPHQRQLLDLGFVTIDLARLSPTIVSGLLMTTIGVITFILGACTLINASNTKSE